jgi:hypothetical protein
MAKPTEEALAAGMAYVQRGRGRPKCRYWAATRLNFSIDFQACAALLGASLVFDEPRQLASHAFGLGRHAFPSSESLRRPAPL